MYLFGIGCLRGPHKRIASSEDPLPLFKLKTVINCVCESKALWHFDKVWM